LQVPAASHVIDALLDFLRTLTNPERLIQLLTTVLSGWWGYAMLAGIVFAETGLLTGFFLPGDSLLFTVGVVCGAGVLNIAWVIVLLIAAAITGNSVGYALGRRTGPRIFSRKDSRFFHQGHLTRTREFYEKHGGKTIILAQFIPILRTFAPFVAGVGQMNYFRFISFNVIGAICWVFSMTMLGYMLGSVPLVRRHFEKVIVLIIVVSLLPVVREAWKARRSPRAAAQ
jgi:membrane-associated protein